MPADPSPAERRAALAELRGRADGCLRCPELVRSRTRVVFGDEGADADVLVVGEAPGRAEEAEGRALAGPSGQLLKEALRGAGLDRAAVAVVTLVRCRPPENRVPLRTEVDHCRGYLEEQVALVRPTVVVALGGLATRTLRGAADPVRRVRGAAEVHVVGGRAVRLLPVLHPAAALYAPATVAQLRADLALVPALLALGPPPQPVPPPEPEPEPPALAEPAPPPDGQLGLF